MANENPKSAVVDLKSAVDGKIQHVSLYSNQAEITRSYTFDVAAGLNQVNIYGLPSLPRLQKDSVRVEGKGSATIHDVTVTLVPIEHVSSTSETLQTLQDEAERVSHSLTRAQNAISSLESYLKSFTASSVNANLLGEQIDNYEAVGEKLDDRVMALKKEQAQLAKKIQEENHRIIVANAAQGDVMTRTKVIVGVFADVAGSVELVLIYVVTSASWDAAYDVRVSPGAKLKEKQAGTPMTIIYKAIVHQNTGEAWNDVPLTLETASPSYGVEIPSLDPWIITKHRPQRRYSLAYGGRGSAAPMMSAMLGSHYDPTVEDSSPEMDHREASVTSQGTINATFSVPGLVSVPCDGDPHTFTIANLELQAELSWVAVPRKDTKVHLKAQVVNTSEYTLLTGQASVFVDGSFIAKANMPAVNPQEKFDYSLGLDPSIRITYHPRIKALSQSGFYNKTATTVFTQRITVHNTKTIAVDNVKILDQIPVSEDADIVVKLDTPSLSVVSGGTVNKLKNTSSSGNAPVKVAAGVVAQWEVNPDEDAEPGRDGKINWLCAVPAQTKVNLVLKWEVTSPARQHVHGLDVSHAK